MPLFFVEVARLLRARIPGLRALVLGDGPMRESMLAALRDGGVDFHYGGFAAQGDLPALYASARVFLFPTRQDPWGVVANEACAAGVPVVTCPNAGAAGDLVLHGINGYVLDTVAEVWCDHIEKLLSDKALWESFSGNAAERVRGYSYEAAADGILRAAAYALSGGAKGPGISRA